MMRPLISIDGHIFEEGETVNFTHKLIKQPLKKKKQKGWCSYRNTYLKKKETFGIYIYNGQNEEGFIVLTRTN